LLFVDGQTGQQTGRAKVVGDKSLELLSTDPSKCSTINQIKVTGVEV
jgi:hypothetical protein